MLYYFKNNYSARLRNILPPCSAVVLVRKEREAHVSAQIQMKSS